MKTRRKQDSTNDNAKPNKEPVTTKRTSTRQRKRQLDENYNVSDFIDQQVSYTMINIIYIQFINHILDVNNC